MQGQAEFASCATSRPLTHSSNRKTYGKPSRSSLRCPFGQRKKQLPNLLVSAQEASKLVSP